MDSILNDVLLSVRQSDMNAALILFNLFMTLFLCWLLALVYKTTHKGLSYSQSFVNSIILIGIIVCSAMMIIGSSLVSAFALLGAFSIIRFRTPVKDVKDISFLFMSLIVGLGIGTMNYQISILTTIFIIIVLFFLDFINFGSMRKYGYILTFNFDTKKGKDNAFKPVFDKYLRSQSLLHVSAVKDGHALDFTFNVNFKNTKEVEKFTSRLIELKGLSNVDLLTAKNDVEY